MFFSIIYNKRVFEGERPVVFCWVAFRGSTKKLYSEKLVVVYCWRDFWQHSGASLRIFIPRSWWWSVAGGISGSFQGLH